MDEQLSILKEQIAIPNRFATHREAAYSGIAVEIDPLALLGRVSKPNTR
jgi:hypothetical protein